MKIAFFSTKMYDREFFDRYNTSHEIIYFDAPLNEQTVNLVKGCKAICAFVNDRITTAVITSLKSNGVELIVFHRAQTPEGLSSPDDPSNGCSNVSNRKDSQ